MDSVKKRQEITALIDNIKNHSDRLTNKANIPILELSVILSKINRLQEKTVVLKYLLASERNMDLNEFEKLSNEELTSALGNETKPEQDHSISTEVQDKQFTKESILQPAVPLEKQTDPTLESKDELEKSEAPPKAVEANQRPEEIKPEKTDIRDDIERNTATDNNSDIPDLNKQYTADEDPSLGEQLKKQPISDLMTAIGLNERYLFANELFEGEMEKFREVIIILNDFSQKDEAILYFKQTLMPSMQWEAKNELVKALYRLIERRYQ